MKQIALCICLVAVATTLYKMLVPEGSLSKQINFLITCFFLAGILQNITGSDMFEDLRGAMVTNGTYIDFSAQISAEQKEKIAAEVSGKVREALAAHDIFPEKIYVVVNISGLYSISINEIELVLAPDADSQKAYDIARGVVGNDIEIVIS